MPGMQQYQVIQETLDEFTVKVVASRNLDEEIHRAFLDHFAYRPRLTIKYLDVIPREPSGKFHAAICRV